MRPIYTTRADRAPSSEDRARRDPPWLEPERGVLLAAAVAGLAFGFLLQKGGVAKFDNLIGVLLLDSFVVAKVLLTAIGVGILGFHLLELRGFVERDIKETRYGANLIGGLIFGVGFGLLAYCPGTDAAAAGQGNLDALVGMLGLLIGSYLFALGSHRLRESPGLGRSRGKLTLASLLEVSPTAAVVIALAVIVLALVAIESLAPGSGAASAAQTSG